MKISLEAANMFLSYLAGKEKLADVLKHPAYQAVFSHSRMLGRELTAEDVRLALDNQQSPFFGLANVRENRGRIQRLLEYIEANTPVWLPQMEQALARVYPNRDTTSIIIYPILGYDVGIGHNNCVSMNVNLPFYSDVPQEFFYLAIHEAFHTLYEQTCPLQKIDNYKNAPKQLELFWILMQNEGYAVYTPLELRRQNGQPGSHHYPTTVDYLAIEDPDWIRRCVSLADDLAARLQTGPAMEMNAYLNAAFGGERIIYRAGCVLVERIEEHGGLDEVRRALEMEPTQYIQRYNHLLDIYRLR